MISLIFARPSLLLPFLLAGTLLLQGCFSQYRGEGNDAFEVTSRQTAAVGVGAPPADNEPVVPSISDERLIAYINQGADLENPWPADSVEVLSQLKASETRTKLEEAALLVGLLRLYLDQRPKPLKSLGDEAGVNLAVAFNSNGFLKTYEIIGLCLKVLGIARNEDPAYVQDVEIPVRALLARWQKLGGEANPPAPMIGPQNNPEAGIPTEELPPAATTPPPAVPSPKPSAEVAPALPYNSDAFVADEAQLRDAQSLIDQGSYQEAIHRLQQFKEGSPFHASAQEKARNAKNLAVQDLRKKAAAAFQSSMPVGDPKAKSVYLKEAEGYLEQALSMYPDAEQIDTVKENLAVIKKNLAQLP
jgi:tetratricopeptide (TPR) repeat protein